ITADFSGQEANVKEYTFKSTLETAKLYGYQSELNPLGKLGMTASNVCLVKVQHKTTDTAAYFKVVFSMTMGQTQSFNMTVVPGLSAGEADKKEIKAAITGITNGYGWLYFKLVGEGGPRVLNNGTTWTGGGTAVPQAADWDILGTRTNELQTEDGTTVSSQMPVASRSSVLLNTYKTVKAKVITGKLIDKVTDADLNDTGLSGEIDAIGYGWYAMAGMPPTFSVAGNTYIVKTVEGKFAKFQPESFYGSNNESFVMIFSYYYKSEE
ncbi:MAG: HmuY family protein, partial [Treponema sp.]|nr:HmuY family protein [Treponema sp.]